MDNLINFFNTLFGIEVAIFGIISAVILVFIQLVFSNYSYKNIGQILKNRYLILFFIFSTVDLLLTSAGSYFLSLTHHNLFPSLDLSSNNIISNQYYALICLLLIFFSISFFGILIAKNITYLQPHRAIFLLSKSIRYEDIRNFIWNKFGLELPYDLRYKIVVDSFEFDEGNEEGEVERIAEENIRDIEDQGKLKVINKQIEAIRKRTANSEDPLLSIRDMMIQFIKRSDLSSLTEAQGLLLSKATGFINWVPEIKKNEWSPNDVLIGNFTRYLIELLSTLLEIAEKERLESGQKIILSVGFNYALSLFHKGCYRELDTIQMFFQQVADSSIGKSSLLFQEIIELYQTLGEKTFDLLKGETAVDHGDGRLDLLDNIFLSIGWLGERLLMKLPIEDEPLMRNYNYSTEYDAFFNCLLSFKYRYDGEQPRLYPLIYFNSLFVVLKKLVQIYKTTKVRNLEENIYSISFAFASFADEAIRAGNARGALLAAIRIKEAYEEIKDAGLEKEANDTIKLLVKIGIMAVGNKEKLTNTNLMSKPLDSWVADTLVEAGENIDDEVFDSYIRTLGEVDHDIVWDYIKKLGIRMGTDFRLTFDPITGMDYPEDDIRRK